jgi:hypothetical protein
VLIVARTGPTPEEVAGHGGTLLSRKHLDVSVTRVMMARCRAPHEPPSRVVHGGGSAFIECAMARGARCGDARARSAARRRDAGRPAQDRGGFPAFRRRADPGGRDETRITKSSRAAHDGLCRVRSEVRVSRESVEEIITDVMRGTADDLHAN